MTRNPQLRFKDSDGKTFSDWMRVNLAGAITSIDAGWSPQCDSEPASSSEWGVLKTTSVTWDGYNHQANKRLLPGFSHREDIEVKEGDILVTRAGPSERVGVVAHVQQTRPMLMLSDKIIRIRCNEQSDSDFVARCLGSPEAQGQLMGRKSGLAKSQTNISQKDLTGLRIRLPTLPEQRKIAEFLTAVDGRIAQLERKKALLEDYKKGVMQQLFTQAIRFKDKVNGEAREGTLGCDHGRDFPEWEEKKLGEVCKCFSGGTPSSGKREFYGGTIPFIRSAEIASPSTALFLTEKGYESSSAKLVETGDLLVALYGANSGEVGISKVNGAINQAVLCIRSTQSVIFLYYWLEYSKDSIVSTFLQGGQGNLSGSIIQSLKINFPSLAEQTKIAEFLTALDRKIAGVGRQIEGSKGFKRGLLQQMFV